MERDILSVMNLYEVFGYIQEQAWATLGRADNKKVLSMNPRQIKAMVIVVLRNARNKEPLTLNGLADLLGMKKSAVSLLVSDLVDKKLLTRSVDPENRRFIRITLATNGRKLGKAMSAEAAKRVGGLLGNLSGEERRNLVVAADKIYESYSREVEGGI